MSSHLVSRWSGYGRQLNAVPFVSISHGFTLHIWIISMIVTSEFGAPELLQVALFAGSASLGYSALYLLARREGRLNRNARLPAAPSQLPALLVAGVTAALLIQVLDETAAWVVVPAVCTALFIAIAGLSSRPPALEGTSDPRPKI